MDFEILGWPDEGPTLDLDHECFAYAGKFVISRTGKAVVRDDGRLVGAVAFDADRTDESVCRLRYVTVRNGRRGEGIGSRLLAFTRAAVHDRGYESVQIAVNNPFAYDAAYRAGFDFTGRDTGIAELVLAWPAPDPVLADPTTGADADTGAGMTKDADTGAGMTKDADTGAGTPKDAESATLPGYRTGMRRFADRSETAVEREFVAAALDRGPPELVETPRFGSGSDGDGATPAESDRG